MIDDLCPLCSSLQTFDGSWPACACDSTLSRTLTVRHAALYLHMSPSGVYHLINDGYLAAIGGSRPLQVRMVALKSFVIIQHIGWQHTHSSAPGCA
jgi:hypothetical protein